MKTAEDEATRPFCLTKMKIHTVISFVIMFWIASAAFNAAADDTRYGYTTQTYRWYDEVRGRTIPARIYCPQSNDEKSDTEKRCPVIVFSHGIGGSIDCCSYLARAWASRGFICVFVQHPGSDENIWQGKVRILNEFKKSFERNKNCRTRAEDLRFALDSLEQLAAEDKELGKKIDFTQIGAGGYDLGALTSLLVAGQLPPDNGKPLYDKRFTAVLAMSPPVRWMNVGFDTIYKDVTVPALFITGTEDDSVVGPTQAIHRRIPFDSMSGNDRWLLTLNGADHRIYGGRFFALTASNDEVFQAAIIRATSCFWQAELQKDKEALSVMSGSGLNSLVRMARVERRVKPVIETPQPLQQEQQAENQQTKPESKEAENITGDDKPEFKDDKLTSFPLTKYYRTIDDKMNDGFGRF